MVVNPGARQPFEVQAAWAMGFALPLLEAARRRTDFSNLPAYVDDFIVGALLLLAARAASRGRPRSRAMLAGAWGILCGGLWGSVFGQLAMEGPTDVSGLSHGVVVAIKLAISAVAVAALVRCVTRDGPAVETD